MRRRSFLGSFSCVSGSFFAGTSGRAAPEAKVAEVRVISQVPELYHGWPTLTRRESGELLVVCSGGREAHVCPFGRTDLMRSSDGGETWSFPRVVMDGPIDDRDAIIRAGLCPKAILRKLTNIACKQVFDHGFFHADAHPGNIFVTKSGSIGAVDFGIMGRLNGKTRHYLANILMAFLNRDYALAAELHFSANWVSKEHSVAQFAQACRAIAEPIMDRPLQSISVARLLAQLFKISKMFDMETQTQLILLQKTLIVAEGTARQLDPNTNSWSLIRPFMEDWVWKESNEGISINKTLDNIYEIVENLPKLVENLKENSVCTKSQSVKLDPDTIQTIKGEEKFSSSLPITSTIIGLLILAYLSIH